MLKRFLLFISSNLLYVLLVIAVYGIGYEHDRAYKLYPETKEMSYDFFMEVYGERWARLAKLMLGLGALTDAAILMIWYRSYQAKSQNRILD